MSVHEYARRERMRTPDRPRVWIDGREWTDELDAEARGWLTDCFPDHAEEIADAPRPRIAATVDKYYDGRLDAFIAATVGA
jgi:hypothetical protein